jgi:hypothetical protein
VWLRLLLDMKLMVTVLLPGLVGRPWCVVGRTIGYSLFLKEGSLALSCTTQTAQLSLMLGTAAIDTLGSL